jgi:hypothetical protein
MNRRLQRWEVALALGLALSTAQTWRRRGGAVRAADCLIFPPGSRATGYTLGLLADAEGAPPERWRA